MSNHNGNANKMVDTPMPQGEQKGSSYILIQHKNHQWIERLDGPSRLPSRYSYYDETAKVVEELNRLADHIKRLEEAGDAMFWAFMHPFDTANESIPDNWRKAKEAKP